MPAWLLANYQSVSLFSLKLGEATSTGAKSLFLPTPFAIRTALLDAAIRTWGLAAGPVAFDAIRGLTLGVSPPSRVAVTNLFTKVLKPQRGTGGEPDEDQQETRGAMQRSIAFREYVYLQGPLRLAFSGGQTSLNLVRELAPRINYFGKRGSFFQLLELPALVDELPQGYVALTGPSVNGIEVAAPPLPSFPLGIIQLMDDWGPGLTYEKVNIYTDERIQLGRDRVRQGVVLPYRLLQSSRGFSLYEQLE